MKEDANVSSLRPVNQKWIVSISLDITIEAKKKKFKEWLEEHLKLKWSLTSKLDNILKGLENLKSKRSSSKELDVILKEPENSFSWNPLGRRRSIAELTELREFEEWYEIHPWPKEMKPDSGNIELMKPLIKNIST